MYSIRTPGRSYLSDNNRFYESLTPARDKKAVKGNKTYLVSYVIIVWLMFYNFDLFLMMVTQYNYRIFYQKAE